VESEEKRYHEQTEPERRTVQMKRANRSKRESKSSKQTIVIESLSKLAVEKNIEEET